ncbi:hypothetical protein K0B96_13080 [Horticoccus luteus]|uniref:N-acetyltransferase domain-containing protein n=1 Tax=Horticoccus luteus TaxID=2862869 RepID=A0A8F9TUX6_9BACT|nr:hypothetical protein [Horticoccus luteus]QYM78229.1 hypothetical protein K0B96_13080 [Horticoccus luteus]
MGGDPATAARWIVVEWCGATTADLRPRVRSGQLPALARLAATGRQYSFPHVPPTDWPLPSILNDLATAGVALADCTCTHLAPTDVISPDDIAATTLRFFPPREGDDVPLRAALACLYSSHNAAIAACFADSPPALIYLPVTLTRDISLLYSSSPALPQALAAAAQLLDLLLHDFRQQADDKTGFLLCSAGHAAAAGFSLLAAPNLPADRLPRIPSPRALGQALATLLDARLPTDSTWALPFPLSAAWLDPQFPPVRRIAVITRERPAFLRLGRPADLTQVATTFPAVRWSPGDILHLAFADASCAALIGAASLSPSGGVSFAALPPFDVHPDASRLFERVLHHAEAHHVTVLHSAVQIEKGSSLHALFSAAGFQLNGEVVMWRVTRSQVLARLAPPPAAVHSQFLLRPPTSADVDAARNLPEAAALLPAGVAFDPDLSAVAISAGEIAGLLLVQRLDDLMVANALVVREKFRRSPCFLALLAHGTNAMRAAGLEQAIFSTDAARREMLAWARRSDAHVIQHGVRLIRTFLSR